MRSRDHSTYVVNKSREKKARDVYHHIQHSELGGTPGDPPESSRIVLPEVSG